MDTARRLLVSDQRWVVDKRASVSQAKPQALAGHTHATGVAAGCARRDRDTLPRLTWLDVLVRVVGPDPASFIHVGSDTEIRRRCHLIDTFILERVHEKPWSLGESNP